LSSSPALRSTIGVVEVRPFEAVADRAEDQRQRGPQLVADVGEEVRAEPVELLELLVGRLLRVALPLGLPLGGLPLGDVAALGQQPHDAAALVAQRLDGEVDRDELRAAAGAEDFGLVAHEPPAGRRADRPPELLVRLAGRLPEAGLPERPPDQLLPRAAAAAQQRVVRLADVAGRVEQRDVLVEVIEQAAGPVVTQSRRGDVDLRRLLRSVPVCPVRLARLPQSGRPAFGLPRFRLSRFGLSQFAR
jgi:hypothetical protein